MTKTVLGPFPPWYKKILPLWGGGSFVTKKFWTKHNNLTLILSIMNWGKKTLFSNEPASECELTRYQPLKSMTGGCPLGRAQMDAMWS